MSFKVKLGIFTSLLAIAGQCIVLYAMVPSSFSNFGEIINGPTMGMMALAWTAWIVGDEFLELSWGVILGVSSSLLWPGSMLIGWIGILMLAVSMVTYKKAFRSKSYQ